VTNRPTVSLWRLRALQLAVLLLLSLFAVQLVRLQIFEGGRFRALASEQILRVMPVEAPRGLITDRNGRVLTHNTAEYALALVPGYLPSGAAERQAALLRVERETGAPLRELEAALAGSLAIIDPFSPVTVTEQLTPDRALTLRAALADVPGARITTHARRVYEGVDLLPQILGYVSAVPGDEVDEYLGLGYPLDARVGRAGVELTYEEALRGTPGSRLVTTDPAGRELEVLDSDPPAPGADVVLSIDLDLQAATAAALEDGIHTALPVNDPKRAGRDAPLAAGAAIVMDAHTGALLALATYPSYDANIFSGTPDGDALTRLLTNPTKPLLQRAYMEVHAPGSIYKPLIGAAALQEGIAKPGTLITSTGAIWIQDEYKPEMRYIFRDWAAHGTLDFYQAIARSSDVYFYYLAGGYHQRDQPEFKGLGPTRLAEYNRLFGLGARTGIDLPGEAEGLVPDPAWKEATLGEPWVLGDTYPYGIGQSYLTVTPLQMAVAGAALANGGDLLTPHVVGGITRGGVFEDAPTTVRSHLPIDAAHLEVVREAMRLAAQPDGTANTGQPAGMTIGGKTGTAEFGPVYPDGSYDSHGWYMGFAPYDDPEIVVVVYLEHGVGQTHAGPVARRIFEAYFGLNQPPTAPGATHSAVSPMPGMRPEGEAGETPAPPTGTGP